MKRSVWRGLVLLLVVSGMLCMPLAPAMALDVKLSGQVNQLVMYADDGHDNAFFIADNDNSGTRVTVAGEQDFGPVKGGVRVEIEAQRNATNELTIGQDSDGRFFWNDRWLEAYFSGNFGKVEIGKGDGAANNTAEVDLSGTSVIIYSRVEAQSGAFEWKNSDGSNYGATVGDTRNNFDGLSRNERIRYNTPNFFGAYLAGSVTNGNAWELAGFYEADLYGKLAAGVGYVNSADRGSEAFDQVSASVSWVMPFGLNVTAAYGYRGYKDSTKSARSAAGQSDSAASYYLKLGYKWGIHAVAVEYGLTNDLNLDGDKSSNIGAAYVIKPWKNVEFYAAARQYMLDAGSGSDPDDIRQVMAGTRIKF